MTTLPHDVRTETIAVAGATPKERGMARSVQIGARIRDTQRLYTELFTSLGISESDIKDAARAAMDAIRDWDPEQHDELTGVAVGAGIVPASLGIIVGRTEILSLAPEPASECSTIAYQQPGNTVSAQTWDWKMPLMRCWHLHRVQALPGQQSYAGLAEYGMTGKIGMNSAGVAVHLNILKHASDAATGVPIHAVLHHVLNRATTADQAIELIKAAPTSASSILTVVDANRAANVEISPHGTAVNVVDGQANTGAEVPAGHRSNTTGWVLRTNHFACPSQAQGALLLDPASNTHARMEYLERSTQQATSQTPNRAEDLVELLRSPVEDHLVNLLPDDSLPANQRSATLVTVRMDPARKTITLSPGAPEYATRMRVQFVLD